jgi:hypothetical protein
MLAVLGLGLKFIASLHSNANVRNAQAKQGDDVTQQAINYSRSTTRRPGSSSCYLKQQTSTP